MKNLKMKSARVAKDLSQQQLADLLRRLLHIPDPRIIAESLPELQKPFLRAKRKRSDVRILRDEAFIIRPHGIHPGLLKHDLRNVDMVRRRVRSPGHISFFSEKPVRKERPAFLHFEKDQVFRFHLFICRHIHCSIIPHLVVKIKRTTISEKKRACRSRNP